MKKIFSFLRRLVVIWGQGLCWGISPQGLCWDCSDGFFSLLTHNTLSFLDLLKQGIIEDFQGQNKDGVGKTVLFFKFQARKYHTFRNLVKIWLTQHSPHQGLSIISSAAFWRKLIIFKKSDLWVFDINYLGPYLGDGKN